MKQWYLYYSTKAAKLKRPIAEVILPNNIRIKDIAAYLGTVEVASGIIL